MRKRTFITLLLLAGLGAGVLSWTAIRARINSRKSANSYLQNWDASKAAAYLDRREVWWQGWKPAKRDHGTICISCHTVVPYAMARPALRQVADETAMTPPEKVLMDGVEKRVGSWSQMVPFYSERNGPDKPAQSRATEAVMNAVILASYDERQGSLRPITRAALDEAWALQLRTGQNAGGWKWQDFNLAPWESSESAYQGAALLAVKVQNAPDGYAAEPGVAPYLDHLRDYLKREYSSQPLMNQIYVLWASGKSPELMTAEQKNTLLATLRSLQKPDGGWALSSLDQGNRDRDKRWQWIRTKLKIADKPAKSDGCATGLIVLVLEKTGTSQQDPMLARGLEWLETHQQSDGSWRAESLNEKRDPETDVGHFMTDAATGYAVLALEAARQQQREAAHL
jgi:squalene-hopene/tetraprenyl-beta-curcumene cyclase